MIRGQQYFYPSNVFVMHRGIQDKTASFGRSAAKMLYLVCRQNLTFHWSALTGLRAAEVFTEKQSVVR